MNLFKSFTMTWWQVGFFKLGMLALGIIIGVYFHQVLANYYAALIVIAVLSLGYVTYVWFRQHGAAPPTSVH